MSRFMPPAASLFEKRLGEKLYAGSYLTVDAKFARLDRKQVSERSTSAVVSSAPLWGYRLRPSRFMW